MLAPGQPRAKNGVMIRSPAILDDKPHSRPGMLFETAFQCGPAQLATALGRLAAEDAVSLPLLSPESCRPLIEAAMGLPYRDATPVVGTDERRVHQDFELTVHLPADSPFHGLAKALERLTESALAHLDPPPLAGPVRLDDLIIQRYPVGSAGITPHRDHIRYRGLVAIVTLSGRARFFICADRSGHDAREIPIPPGSLLLMRAPGFAGREDRPFQMLSHVTEERLSLGLRHDVRA